MLIRPEIIGDSTRAYLDEGSDIVSTNTFNANRISQADYGPEHLVVDMNHAAAPLPRAEADDLAEQTAVQRFLAAAIGPTNKTLSQIDTESSRESVYPSVYSPWVAQ